MIKFSQLLEPPHGSNAGAPFRGIICATNNNQILGADLTRMNVLEHCERHLPDPRRT